MENEDHLLDQLLNTRGEIGEKLKASRQQIIIQASLIDRIPNLAGLARTCEVTLDSVYILTCAHIHICLTCSVNIFLVHLCRVQLLTVIYSRYLKQPD